MTMRVLFQSVPAVACALFVVLQPVSAQDTMREAEFDDLPVPGKKRPSIFHRPTMDSSADQLAYAERLLAEGKIRKAMKQYQALVHTWHDSREAAIAQLDYAKLLEDRRRYRQAFDAFQYLIDNYAGQFPYEEALQRQFRIAHYVMTERRGKFFVFPGFSAPERALPFFEKLVENAPNWSKTPHARFLIGQIYETTKQYELAVNAYEAAQNLYPDSPFTGDASFRRACCLCILANASPRDASTCRRALSALSGFLGDFPSDANASVIRGYLGELKRRLASMHYERAAFYDRIANRPRAALIAYSDFIKQFPSSEMGTRVNKRIEALKIELEEENEN